MKKLLLLLLLCLVPGVVFAYTDNTVVSTIQPISVSIDFDSSDAAVCTASDPADIAFVIRTYNPNVGYVYDGDLFTNLPFTIATSSSPTNQFYEVQVFCTADGSNPDYGAPNWTYSLGFNVPGAAFSMYQVVDASSSPATSTVVTATSTSTSNFNQDVFNLIVLFWVCFFGFYWAFSKKR